MLFADHEHTYIAAVAVSPTTKKKASSKRKGAPTSESEDGDEEGVERLGKKKAKAEKKRKLARGDASDQEEVDGNAETEQHGAFISVYFTHMMYKITL